MKRFDMEYKLLDDMDRDGYFPDFLLDKVKVLVQMVMDVLETGERNILTWKMLSAGETGKL